MVNEFFEKVQKLSLTKKKIIAVLIVLLIGFLLFYFVVLPDIKGNISQLENQNLIKNYVKPLKLEEVSTSDKEAFKKKGEKLEKLLKEFQQAEMASTSTSSSTSSSSSASATIKAEGQKNNKNK